jgi:hypothetical protein
MTGHLSYHLREIEPRTYALVGIMIYAAVSDIFLVLYDVEDSVREVLSVSRRSGLVEHHL